MDLSTANRLLKYLKSQTYLFQPYPEKNKGEKKYSPIWRSLASARGELEKAQEEFAAIGVVINEIPEGKARLAENVTGYRAVWCEDDSEAEITVDRFPLEPTIIIESSPDLYHYYWFIDRSKGEMTEDEWRSVMDVMVSIFGSDKGHPNQALRLPGSYHQKKDSWKVKINAESGKLYSASELLGAFGTLADYGFDETEGKHNPVPVDWEHDKDRIVEALKYIPADVYDTWRDFGFAIFDASGGADEGFRVWDDWCKTAFNGSYSPQSQWEFWYKTCPKRTYAGDRVGAGTIFSRAIDAGWNVPKTADSWTREKEQQAYVDFSDNRVNDDVFPAFAIERVRQRFREWQHAPSEEHWAGLTDIAKVFHRMAVGCLRSDRHYLSSLPCGMGKTTVVTQCTKALLEADHSGNCGVIYFLSRLEEINSLVTAMGLTDDDFAVLVSEGRKGDVARMGRQDVDNAKVLFTTQQQLEARLRNKEFFAELDAFYYKGKPRSVRVWDEAIIPSRVLTLERYDVDRLKADLKANGEAGLADTLDVWSFGLRELQTGDIVEVPEVNANLPSLEHFREMFKESEDKDRAEALWYLSGRSVRIRRDNLSGATTLDYNENLPDDLSPMLILDASGGLRETYSFWQKHRKGLVRLQSPQKTYGGLTIHHWNRGAGKTANKDWDKAKEIADGVIKVINTEIPKGDDVLVIYHKPTKKGHPNMEELIGKSVALNPNTKVHYVNWGKHTATNQYAHIKHVILAGILQYNDAQYEAVGRASKKARTEDAFEEDDFQRTRFGEIAHNIFQAACRGMVRKTENGDCPSGCHLYIIFSTDKRRGFSREGLQRIFPDAPIIDWEPFGKQLTGKAKEAFDFIQGVFGSQTEKLKASDVMDQMGMQKSNFYKLIDRDDLSSALLAEGIQLDRPKGLPGYFHKKKTLLPWDTGMARAGGVEF